MSPEGLHKGEELNLLEKDPALHNVLVGLGWDAPPKHEGNDVDLDASAFLLNRDNRVRMDTDFVFYNNLSTENGAVEHLGDCSTGQSGDNGDDEEIRIKLEEMPFDVERVAFAVTLHNAEERGETFGLVRNAFIRIVNADTNVELARFDLTEDASNENGIIFGELVRAGVGWIFRALGQGTDGGLYRIAKDFGVNVSAA